MISEEMRSDFKSPSNIPTVAILMATYNGERFLIEQLESFADQTVKDWVLWVSDDGSSDKTIDILKNFADKFPFGKVNIVEGPKSGFARNFLSLIGNFKVIAKNYAYADQDDVWHEDKLERAVNYLGRVPLGMPALYCSRTEYVDENLHHIGYSDDYHKPPSFLNAMVQNIASGNTMVFNDVAKTLIMNPGQTADVPLHDWWTYLVVTGCGGEVWFDREPSVYYRQHSGNLWGMNTGWLNRANRVKKLFEGRFRDWNTRHINELRLISHRLKPENKEILNHFASIRHQPLPSRLYSVKTSGFYRQTRLGNLGLLVASIFNKI